jgi:hypothetical protein
MIVLKKMHLNPGEHKEQSRVWLGPYEVMGKGSEVNYWIDKDGVLDLVHVDRMKKYVDGRPLPPLQPRGAASPDVALEDEEEKEQSEAAPPEEEAEVIEQDEEVIRAEEIASNMYELEEILESQEVRSTSSRLRGKKSKRYLVKWKNFDNTHNSWEPESALEGCEEFIQAFEAKERDRRATARAERKQQGELRLINWPLSIRD